MKNCLAIINPELSKQWHPTKNGDLMPNDVTAGSGKKVWWQCEKGHEWEVSINNRTNGTGCPYCSGKRACADNSLQALNPELSKQWHPSENEGLTTNDVTASSNKRVWWQCERGHEWKAPIDKRSIGHGCPYCSGHRVCTDNCLQTINPDLAKQWHPVKNEGLTPDGVTEFSNKKIWWCCRKGHEWAAVISSRTNGNGCPVCSQEKQTSFPEQAIYFYLKSVFSDTLNRYKYNNKWEIDVFVSSLNFGIEYDGIYYHKGKNDTDYKKEKYIASEEILLLIVKEIDTVTEKCYRKGNSIYCSKGPSESQLNGIISACFEYISDNITYKSCSVDINVKRDRLKYTICM